MFLTLDLYTTERERNRHSVHTLRAISSPVTVFTVNSVSARHSTVYRGEYIIIFLFTLIKRHPSAPASSTHAHSQTLEKWPKTGIMILSHSLGIIKTLISICF